MITDNMEIRSLNDPVTLALAVVMDRVRHLSQDDRQDLYELSRIAFLAESNEEKENAAAGMLEILEQRTDTLHRMLPATGESQELNERIALVSQRIKALRTQTGLTQVELAQQSGIPQSHISRLENGEHSPSSVTLEKLAKALRVPVSELDCTT